MTWLTNNWAQVIELLGQHLALAVPAILASFVLAVPMGVLAARRPGIGRPLVAGAGMLYAIPALPLLIILPLVFGLPLRSPVTVVVALTIYGTALMVGTSADAFSAVDATVRESAQAMGHSRAAMLFTVDLPLAGPVLLSGVRVVAVSTVSLVTIGALIGVPGLGSLLTDGFQRGILAEVITGILTTVAVALAADAALVGLGRVLMPWTRREHRP